MAAIEAVQLLTYFWKYMLLAMLLVAIFGVLVTRVGSPRGQWLLIRDQLWLNTEYGGIVLWCWNLLHWHPSGEDR